MVTISNFLLAWPHVRYHDNRLNAIDRRIWSSLIIIFNIYHWHLNLTNVLKYCKCYCIPLPNKSFLNIKIPTLANRLPSNTRFPAILLTLVGLSLHWEVLSQHGCWSGGGRYHCSSHISTDPCVHNLLSVQSLHTPFVHKPHSNPIKPHTPTTHSPQSSCNCHPYGKKPSIICL